MLGIRQKLMLGFAGLSAIVVVIGVLTMVQLGDLGGAIDVILRENYRSVIACQEMKESLERIDSGLMFYFVGRQAESRRDIEKYTAEFQKALDTELHNITMPGEGGKGERIRSLFAEYLQILPLVANVDRPAAEREKAYFTVLLPRFQEIKGLAQDILEMNQRNMYDANETARQQASSARRRMLLAIITCAVIAILFGFYMRRWILKPIHLLIDSANEIQKGNLDLVLPASSKDEIGRLSEAFNAMVEGLRRIRRSDRMEFIRTRRATEEVFKALPTAIAILDPDGRVEIATETAEKRFGLSPGARVRELGFDWMTRLVERAWSEGHPVEHEGEGGFVQRFVENREHFFHPLVIPIAVEPGRRKEPTGVAVILTDVTQVHEQQELKRGVVATVFHQLKTPLTSLRMSIHLLLNEMIGPLNNKQTELLLAAREDSERLVGILDDLLDLNRIEAGHARLDLRPVSPAALAREALEPFLPEAKDKGITLSSSVSADLPEVLADAKRIKDVWANLLSNALRFTGPGGSVQVEARAQEETIRFLVIDTGGGIPSEYLGRVYEQFFRIPGQEESSGVGLGLAIVKEIVQAHGGEVGVESEEGKGSTFWFTLPRADRTGSGHKP